MSYELIVRCQCHCRCMCRLLVVSSCRSRRHLVRRVTLSTRMSPSKCLVFLRTVQRNAQRPSTTLVGSSCADMLSLSLLGIYLRPSDIGCQYPRSIYTVRFIMWQPRATDTSTNWRQSLFCCCTASMEQDADGAETAAIDGLVSS